MRFGCAIERWTHRWRRFTARGGKGLIDDERFDAISQDLIMQQEVLHHQRSAARRRCSRGRPTPSDQRACV